MTGFGNSMEMLASNGILNFDADAFVMGTAPKYVGSPEPKVHLPMDAPLPACNSMYGYYGYGTPFLGGVRIAPQPSADAFIPKHHIESGVSLKTGLLAGLAALLGLGLLAKLPKKEKIKAAAAKAAETAKHTATDLAEKAKQTTETAKSSSTTQKAKSLVSSAWSKVKGLFKSKWTKLGVGALAGFTILYGAKKAFSGTGTPTTHEVPQHNGLPEYPMH